MCEGGGATMRDGGGATMRDGGRGPFISLNNPTR